MRGEAYALRCLRRRIASATAADAAITRTPQTTRTVRSGDDEAGWTVAIGPRTVMIGRTFSADAPYASVTVTVGVYVPALEYEWLAVAPVPVAPSPNSQWYVYGPPAPPDATAANEIVSPSTADVVASVAIARTSEVFTASAIVDGGVPAAASRTVTIAV